MHIPFRFFTTLLFISILFSSGAQVIGDTYASAKKTKAATVTFVYNGVYGFIEKGNDGIERGLLVDLMSEFEDYVFDKKGITVNHKYVFIEDGSFPKFMQQVKNSTGGVFGLSNVSINEERRRLITLVLPFWITFHSCFSCFSSNFKNERRTYF